MISAIVTEGARVMGVVRGVVGMGLLLAASCGDSIDPREGHSPGPQPPPAAQAPPVTVPASPFDYRVCHRVAARETFVLPNDHPGSAPGAVFDESGGLLVESADPLGGTVEVSAITPHGVRSLVYSAVGRRPTLDGEGRRFAVYPEDDAFEVYDRTGRLQARGARTQGRITFVPGGERFLLAEVPDSLDKFQQTHEHVYEGAAPVARFATPRHRYARVASDRYVYWTVEELVRMGLDGTEVWRLSVRPERLELSANGQLAIVQVVDRLATPIRSEIVHVEVGPGELLERTSPLDSAVRDIAVAPSGRYSAVVTERTLLIFDRGRMVERASLPVTEAASVDITDEGIAAVAADNGKEGVLLLVGCSSGTPSWSAPVSSGFTGHPDALRFSPDGTRLVAVGSPGVAVFDVTREH